MANSHWVSLCAAHFPEHEPGNRLFFTPSLSSYYYQCHFDTWFHGAQGGLKLDL